MYLPYCVSPPPSSTSHLSLRFVWQGPDPSAPSFPAIFASIPLSNKDWTQISRPPTSPSRLIALILSPTQSDEVNVTPFEILHPDANLITPNDDPPG
ncbi:hypothetical protein Cob_v003783 [Colletotrichum orbiculare MAFF 240422]|uniref:Uncharacterized protein n=1 Tax=Colletotrichum orbiculare (strain 104-T / ATCC 96160 / CBS 514.97 / LARS 414 / MAFF 240422) TaxID=1213857 RepID=A0A484G1K5_COLOR|nr:hypothetical protein Cob_v003783 [Colletotrichum orbiculare MAFF 240422]